MKQMLLSLLLLCSLSISAQDVVVTRQKKQQTTTTKPKQNSTKPAPANKPQQTGGNTQTVNKGEFSQVINILVGWIENINRGNPITKQSMLQMKGQLEGKVSNNDLIHIDKAVQYYVNKEYSRQKAELEKLTEILQKK